MAAAVLFCCLQHDGRRMIFMHNFVRCIMLKLTIFRSCLIPCGSMHCIFSTINHTKKAGLQCLQSAEI